MLESNRLPHRVFILPTWYLLSQRTLEIWTFAIQFAFKYFMLNQKWTYGKVGPDGRMPASTLGDGCLYNGVAHSAPAIGWEVIGSNAVGQGSRTARDAMRVH
jgi:hypothetical protein